MTIRVFLFPVDKGRFGESASKSGRTGRTFSGTATGEFLLPSSMDVKFRAASSSQRMSRTVHPLRHQASMQITDIAEGRPIHLRFFFGDPQKSHPGSDTT